MRKSISMAVFALAILTATACGAPADGGGSSGSGDGGGDECTPGEEVVCVCDAGGAGGKICKRDGSFGACVCDGPECSVTDPNAGTIDFCGGEAICLGGACESAFGRYYTIFIGSVRLNERDDNGDAWDAFGGLPDPIVEVKLNDIVIGTTPYVQDSTSAEFSEVFEAQIAAGSTMEVVVYDSDDAFDDFAFGCRWEPLGADVLRGGSLYCESDTGNSVSGWITPR